MPKSQPQERKNNIGNLIKREPWFEANTNPVLPETLKFPLPTTAHALNHSVDKVITFMNQYWWGNINKAERSAYFASPTCPKYNPGKPVSTAPGHFKLPNGPFEVWQMDFIQLLCLRDVNICFSHGLFCFSTWSKPFHVDKLLPLQWLKYYYKRLSLPGEPLLSSIATGEFILLVKYYSKSVLFGQSYSIFTVLITLSLQD